MPLQQPADGAFVHFVTYLCLEGSLNFPCRGNFPTLGSAEKGSQEGALFFPGQ
jgi:hypothetical protein